MKTLQLTIDKTEYHNCIIRIVLAALSVATLSLPALADRSAINPSEGGNNIMIAKELNNKGDSVRYKKSHLPHIESVLKSSKIITFGGDNSSTDNDSIRELMAKFYADQYRHFQDPEAPYFMFMSRDASMAFGVGGSIKLHGWFDWNGTMDGTDFVPYDIDIPKDLANTRHLGASASESSLFFTLLGKNRTIGNYQGYLQVNFSNGSSNGCKLKKAYIILEDWTVGYATSTFSDPGAQAPIIDGGDMNGKVGRTNMLVRYAKKLKRWTVGGGLEFPSSYIQTNEFTKKSSDWLPDIVASGQYSWDKGLSHVKVAAMLRSISYRNLITEKNHTLPGWGVMLSGVFSTTTPFTLYGIASVGAGHASYTNDLSNGNYDLITDPNADGHLYAPLSYSFCLGAKYSINHNLMASISLSELRFHPKHTPDPTDYKRGMYGSANIMWSITPRLMLGGEYVVGRRQNFNGEHASVNRIDALLQLSF